MPNFTGVVTEISWVVLKNALNKAADAYLNSAEVRKSELATGFFAWMSQVSHGARGRFRAQNLKSLTGPGNNINHETIFILLKAVFQSDSGLLKKFIADELFVGRCQETTVYGCQPEKTGEISSPVFLSNFLDEVTKDRVSYDRSASEVMSIDTFNKGSAVTVALDKLTRRYACSAYFNEMVTQYLKMLETEPDVMEQQMSTILIAPASR